MASEGKAVVGAAGTAFCALGTATGGLLTAVTFGQAQWAKDMTKDYADATAKCASYSATNLKNSTVASAATTAGAGVAAAGGMVATGVTLGQVDATKQFTQTMVDETHDALAKTGERVLFQRDGQFSVGWARGGKKYYPCTRSGVSHDRLQVALVGAAISDGSDRTRAKERAGGGNLSGIVKDVGNMYDYFMKNGAVVDVKSDQLPAPSGAQKKAEIINFVGSPGNNKFLFISGHGNEEGEAALGNGYGVDMNDVLAELNRVSFTGHMTICIDTCFAAQWINQAQRAVKNASKTSNLTSAANSTGRTVRLNFRCSSLAGQKSNDTADGGLFTQAAILAMWREERFAGNDYPTGWGTDFFVKSKVEADWQHSTCFTSYDKQTDVLCDLWYDPARKSWFRSCPEDHKALLDSW